MGRVTDQKSRLPVGDGIGDFGILTTSIRNVLTFNVKVPQLSSPETNQIQMKKIFGHSYFNIGLLCIL